MTDDECNMIQHGFYKGQINCVCERGGWGRNKSYEGERCVAW